jgi:hypothetical protein
MPYIPPISPQIDQEVEIDLFLLTLDICVKSNDPETLLPVHTVFCKDNDKVEDWLIETLKVRYKLMV